jgi:hypothetical protein
VIAGSRPERPSAARPTYLIADGARYPVVAPDALPALAYTDDQLHVLQRPWLDLLPEGPTLETFGRE